MTQKESSVSPVFSQLINPDIAGLGQKNLETLITVQRQFFDAVNKANREWLACLNDGATLTSTFAKKMTSAKSIPEAAAVYQEWGGQQMELFSRQAKKVFEEAQDFAQSCTKIMADGEGNASL
jgi:hypothetical protein